MSVGERVREARELLAMSTQEASKICNMREQYFIDIEYDRVPGLSSRTLLKIADAFGISLDYLLGKEQLLPGDDVLREVDPKYEFFVSATIKLILLLGVLTLTFVLLTLGSVVIFYFLYFLNSIPFDTYRYFGE